MHQTCAQCVDLFQITDADLAFLDRMQVPKPTCCPPCRMRRRLTFRNERTIYGRKCDLCHKDMISIYDADAQAPVYCATCWWGDGWDARSYGQEFDFSRPFFDQFRELMQRVPRFGLQNTFAENSEFCNNTTGNKNCYLVFCGDYNEDSMYSVLPMHCKDVASCYWIFKCELSYGLVDCNDCYNVQYSRYASQCHDSAFLYDCRNCNNCFGSVNLRNKKYHFFNKEYSPEEYARLVAAYRLDTHTGVERARADFAVHKLKYPHRHAFIQQSENVSGDDITGANNCHNVFDVGGEVRDCYHSVLILNMTDAMDASWAGYGLERAYDILSCIYGQNMMFTAYGWHTSDTEYSEVVFNSHDLFGCTSMHHAQYCILNKQYDKETYTVLKKKIIEYMRATGEYGEFFPAALSPFAYNETVAQDYFPMTQEAVKATGLRWKDQPTYQGATTPIPDAISDVRDDITKQTLTCNTCQRSYRIIAQELKLYRKLQVPIPRLCFECRFQALFKQRNPRKLFERSCSKCREPIRTSFSPERLEIVYCEQCFLNSVY